MQKKSEAVLFEGKWLKFKELIFTNQQEQDIAWEAIERKNTTKVVIVVAKIMPSERYVLIKQFRPAINDTVISFPAGIAQSNDIEKEAQKELQEETGYIGEVKFISPDLAFNPSMTSEYANIVFMEIDEKDARNIDPQQSLEPEEQIEVKLVSKDKMKHFIDGEIEKGQQVSVALWYILNNPF